MTRIESRNRVLAVLLALGVANGLAAAQEPKRAARSFAFQKLRGSSFLGFLAQPLAQDGTRPKTAARAEEKPQSSTPRHCALGSKDSAPYRWVC